MIKETIINSFDVLGKALAKINSEDVIIKKAHIENQWFIPEFTLKSLKYWSNKLTISELTDFTKDHILNIKPKTVGLITAGNIPLAGFHDILCILLMGHICKIKISSSDLALTNWIIEKLKEINSEFSNRIEVAERLNNCDAYIATGSNNTSRYFEYYFREKPSIIRKNRNSVAILTGNETDEDFQNLANDIFTYFGLGCRNVAKIFIPENYSFNRFYENLENFRFVENHNKYINNYIYHKSIFLMNNTKHMDNGFLLLKEDTGLYSPLSCIFYSYYKNLNEVEEFLYKNDEKIQIVLSGEKGKRKTIAYGKSQEPELNDFADNIDTLSFLSKL